MNSDWNGWIFGLFFVVTVLTIAAAGMASRSSYDAGYTAASAEQTARQSEHARLMQKIGTCKWAKIIADDLSCKRELP